MLFNVNFLYFDDANIPEISLKMIDSYQSANDWCEAEKINRVDKVIPKYTDTTPEETSLLQIELVEGDGAKTMLDYEITNENSPYEKIEENRYRFYMNRMVKNGSGEGTAPSYIRIPNEFAKFIKNENITLAYNTHLPIYDVTRVRYDFISIDIVKSTMQNNGVLQIETALPHEYVIGDEVTIENSERNGLIDGKFKVLGATDVKLILEF